MYSENEKQILVELKALSTKGKIKAINSAPNAVGMTFKKAMGINSTNYVNNRYRGFTLRATTNVERGNSLVNLFAKVPNWKKSECKSSSEILDKYGTNNQEKKFEKSIFCTVNSLRPNSFGFKLIVDNNNKVIYENFYKDKGQSLNVCVWDFDVLEKKLSELNYSIKIKGDKYKNNNQTYFHYSYATFTGQSSFKHFLDLVEDGSITLDHLISRKIGDKATKEKGPKFRISENSFHRLFPNSKYIDLLD